MRSADLAELAVNVLDVVHERTASTLAVDEVEVALQVETRGPEHRFAVEQTLRDLGYVITYREAVTPGRDSTRRPEG